MQISPGESKCISNVTVGATYLMGWQRQDLANALSDVMI
jgi:hypothetical protein